MPNPPGITMRVLNRTKQSSPVGVVSGAKALLMVCLGAFPASSEAQTNPLFEECADLGFETIESQESARQLLLICQRAALVEGISPAEMAAALVFQGRAMEELGRVSEALSLKRQAQAADPNNPFVHMDIGYTLALLHRYDDSIAEYRRVVEIDPDDADGYAGLGIALAKVGRYSEATAMLQKSVQLNPLSVENLSNLAVFLGVSGNLVGALEAARKAHQTDPQSVEANGAMNIVLNEMGRFDEALPYARRAASLGSDDAQRLVEWAFTAYNAGELSEAAEAMRWAIKLEPSLLEEDAEVREVADLLGVGR